MERLLLLRARMLLMLLPGCCQFCSSTLQNVRRHSPVLVCSWNKRQVRMTAVGAMPASWLPAVRARLQC
jgi:hypothetical protein